jgi:hypothetical protein
MSVSGRNEKIWDQNPYLLVTGRHQFEGGLLLYPGAGKKVSENGKYVRSLPPYWRHTQAFILGMPVKKLLWNTIRTQIPNSLGQEASL